MTILSLMKMAVVSPNRKKTQWEKEKLLVMSNFSFSYCVFKRLVLQTRKSQVLIGKGLNAVQIMMCVSNRGENIMGKGENAGYQHFLLIPQCFQKASLSGLLKIRIVW